MSFPAPSFNTSGGSSQPWPAWGSFQSASQAQANSNSAPVPVSSNTNSTNGSAPYVLIPVPVPMQEQPKRQSYHVSFVNENNMLSIRLVNNRTHTVTTNVVGRGTKFECEIPIDQNVDVAVTVLPEQLPENNGIIAQVDNDPFGIRRLGR